MAASFKVKLIQTALLSATRNAKFQAIVERVPASSGTTAPTGGTATPPAGDGAEGLPFITYFWYLNGDRPVVTESDTVEAGTRGTIYVVVEVAGEQSVASKAIPVNVRG